jgi:hypothetical protein
MNRGDLLSLAPPLPGDAYNDETNEQIDEGEGETSPGATWSGQEHA